MFEEYDVVRVIVWKGAGTYSLNEPSLAPMAECEVFVYCDSIYQLEGAVNEYMSNYGITPMVQKVEDGHGRCYC